MSLCAGTFGKSGKIRLWAWAFRFKRNLRRTAEIKPSPLKRKEKPQKRSWWYPEEGVCGSSALVCFSFYLAVPLAATSISCLSTYHCQFSCTFCLLFMLFIPPLPFLCLLLRTRMGGGCWEGVHMGSALAFPLVAPRGFNSALFSWQQN